MKSLHIPALALSLGLILSLNSCGSNNSSSDQTNGADSTQTLSVTIATAVRDTVNISEELTATITAKVTNNISAQAGGRLTRLHVKVGDRVRAGQTIANLDASQLSQAKIQMDDARTNLGRVTELYQIGGVSKAQWEQAQTGYNLAKIAYNNLLTNTHLTSPISGIVTKKNYDSGDMTSPQLPVVVVEQISPVKATISLSERYYSAIRKGTPAHVLVEALGEQPIEAYVSNVFPTVDPVTHTFNIEIEVPNRDEALRPGMFSRVRLDLGKSEAILVPDASVQRMVGSGQRYVYVVQDGKAIYRPIEIGKLYGDKYEVISGIEPGEVVITSSVNNLTNGVAIEPVM